MKRASRRVDRVIRIVDELLSRELQRSTRSKLLRLRRELKELGEERDVGKQDYAGMALRWATIVAKIHDVIASFLE
jgi:hypothetical protein